MTRQIPIIGLLSRGSLCQIRQSAPSPSRTPVYGRRSFGRPKSGNIAVLSPHPPVIGPHATANRAVVILGFADRGSPDLAASVVGRFMARSARLDERPGLQSAMVHRRCRPHSEEILDHAVDHLKRFS